MHRSLYEFGRVELVDGHRRRWASEAKKFGVSLSDRLHFALRGLPILRASSCPIHRAVHHHFPFLPPLSSTASDREAAPAARRESG
jgi:hypothetical protein